MKLSNVAAVLLMSITFSQAFGAMIQGLKSEKQIIPVEVDLADHTDIAGIEPDPVCHCHGSCTCDVARKLGGSR
ncbi:uncharacterized protein MELLADRAFT_124515 [Melampsora larici-populina 98AG31]|uniref:Secreted protein n=1 Tax=Melampsora larici-populina (strain 98AG31 / pathotype 3-4-7) TaxID=747676 RepID=F4RG12_MELLP|nr:uncharacterized protein MELLADRAFT_124515 [Melampsora larici-populina 98AG31]EGG08470.1 secreted protein [Melampsora larici-populina 98AG31]